MLFQALLFFLGSQKPTKRLQYVSTIKSDINSITFKKDRKREGKTLTPSMSTDTILAMRSTTELASHGIYMISQCSEF